MTSLLIFAGAWLPVLAGLSPLIRLAWRAR